MDNSGNLVWHKNIGNPFGADGTGTTDSERAYSVVQTNDNGFAIGGYSEASENFGMGNDYYVIKIASDILSVEDFKIHELIAYPNPTSDILNINLQAKKIEVYDISVCSESNSSSWAGPSISFFKSMCIQLFIR